MGRGTGDDASGAAIPARDSSRGTADVSAGELEGTSKNSASADDRVNVAAAAVDPVGTDADDERYDHLFECREHDYDPRWDYTIRLDQLEHPLLGIARRRLDGLAGSEQTPFERGHVWPADLASGPSAGAIGVYCSGTYNEPVILIDLDAHAGYEEQIVKTLEHEVVHAIQESDWDGSGEWVDEDEAEGFSFS